MDQLIFHSLQGRTTPDQEKELRRWREASLDHERRYQEMAEVWQATASADPVDFRIPAPSLAELEGRRLAAHVGRGRSPILWGRPLVWAAAIVVSLGIGSWAGHSLIDSDDPVPAQISQVVTGPGEMATATLPDGSVIRVAPNTRVQSSIGASERWVEVDGQIFLAVTPDSARPFHVRTGGGEATVLGTRFEVNARHDEMNLMVVEGSVSVRGGGEEVEVRAGERSQSRSDQGPRVEPIADPEELLGWMGAFVAFESTPLPRVARELERRAGISIRIMDPELHDRTVTGWFSESEMEHVVELVCRAAAVTCTVSADTIRMLP